MFDRLVKFLRANRWLTRDEEYARKSLWQYGPVEDGVFATSILGVINGILPFFGICLTIHIDDCTKKPLYFSVKRKWW